MLRTEDDLKSIPYSIRTVDTIQDSPFYSPVSKECQILKCNFLGLPFRRELVQAEYYIHQPLGNFIPLQQEPTEPDGNCFFRAISV